MTLRGFAATALAACVLCAASGAFGHAVVVGTEPADGAVLTQPPVAVIVRFNEPVTRAVVRLFLADGTAVPLTVEPLGAGDAFRVPLPADLRDGRYLLSFRVASADSHVVPGAVAFVVGTVDTAAPGMAADDGPSSWHVALAVLNALATVLTIGWGLYLLAIAPVARNHGVVAVAGTVTAVTALAGIAAYGSDIQGGAVTWLDGAVWRSGLASARGTAALASVVGAGLVVVGTRIADGARRAMLLVAGIATLTVAQVVTGHAATASARALTSTALALHVLGAAFWTGSLVALALTLAPPRTDAALGAVQRFSRKALFAVPAMLLAGVVVAIAQLATLRDLVDTEYGRWIVAKAVIFVMLLLLAVANRYRWLPRAARGDKRALALLRRSIASELALITVAIVAAALLAQTPPRREGTAQVAAWQTTLQRGDLRVDVTVDPQVQEATR